ncbi:MAG: ParB/RepB/Spo0J family partition protein [Oscillospiraceae bacterium]|nr:ParB/RepB/Spo0J family partition protein [Oscillospiraceae bacterium]
MAKKNYRCPLQAECERSCKFHGRELDCDYYHDNARDGYVIEDQEEQRRKLEEEWAEQFYGNLLDQIEDEEAGDSEHSAGTGKLVMLPVDKIHPHPDNPRKELGDLTELAESIKANGVLQNLTVVRGHRMTAEEYADICASYRQNPTEETRTLMNRRWLDSDYTAIIGHRRLAASKLAGLKEVPCVVVEMTPAEQFATMMVENVQRSDLTVYEQAQGFQTMLDLGGTVEEVARQTGFSQSTVRRRLNLMKLDQKKFKDSMSRGATLTDYMELDKIKDDARRNKVLEEIGTPNFKAALKSALAQEEIEQKIAHWESLVSPFAKKVPQRPDYATHLTVKQFTRYDKQDAEEYTAPEDAETEEYYYFVDKSFGVYLYKKRGYDPAVEERTRIREALEEAFQRKKAEAEEISDLHRELRKEFMMEFKPGKQHFGIIAEFAVQAIAYSDKAYATIDDELLADLLGITPDEDDAVAELDEFRSEVKNNPARGLLATAYAYISQENRERYWTWRWEGDGKEILWEENERLNLLYDVLTKLGYEMSDEELQMRNGTHELFKRNDE